METARESGPFLFRPCFLHDIPLLHDEARLSIVRISPLVSLVSLSVALAGCAAGDVDLESRSISLQQTPQPAGALLTQGMASLVSQVGPSYVTLTVSKVEDKTRSGEKSGKTAVTSGSGFVVESDGYVLTAAHVAVKSGNSVSARAANGRVYSGTVVGILPENDIALIKLRGFKGHAAVPVANACMNTGATLFSLGKPHAQGDTARFGTVISMNFGKPVRYGKYGYPDAMVMKMNTQKGESGGPVFDGQGRLVGMVVSTLADANGMPLNMAHAVPSATLARFLCSNTKCSVGWTALTPYAGQNCGST
jgi:S1-C subfamily serine protease